MTDQQKDHPLKQEGIGTDDPSVNSDVQELKPPADEKDQKEKKKKEKKKKTVGQEILSWVGTLLLAVVIAMTIRALLFEPIRVDGPSMLETLQNGEIVLVTKPAVLLNNLKRGDVVICRFPNRNTSRSIRLGSPVDLSLVQHELFIKRLVAFPGDSVAVLDGKLYINDVLIEEEYITYPPVRNFARDTLGENEYMVMGDNRRDSHDSRSGDVGPISYDMIVGKASFVLWPLNRMRPIK